MAGRRFACPLPRTLFSQTVALLFAAVLGAQAVSWLIHMEEKEFAAQKVHIDHALARTASTVRLLDATPAGLHPDYLEAASSKDFRFSLTPEPQVRSEERR